MEEANSLDIGLWKKVTPKGVATQPSTAEKTATGGHWDISVMLESNTAIPSAAPFCAYFPDSDAQPAPTISTGISSKKGDPIFGVPSLPRTRQAPSNGSRVSQNAEDRQVQGLEKSELAMGAAFSPARSLLQSGLPLEKTVRARHT